MVNGSIEFCSCCDFPKSSSSVTKQKEFWRGGGAPTNLAASQPCISNPHPTTPHLALRSIVLLHEVHQIKPQRSRRLRLVLVEKSLESTLSSLLSLFAVGIRRLCNYFCILLALDRRVEMAPQANLIRFWPRVLRRSR